MTVFDPGDHPHRRFDALSGEWVLVSPHRTKRPWQGRQDPVPPVDRPSYDPSCYLCPGNGRAGGQRNPPYAGTFAFPNDFAALLPDVPDAPEAAHPLLGLEAVRGTCRVLCFSPRHDLTLADLGPADLGRVVDLWAAQTAELGQRYRWVQVFENKGELMGCSNPHPHGQVWAGTSLPNAVAKEDRQQRAWAVAHDTSLLVEYARLEAARGERVVVEEEDWLVVVPWWAVWPFETLLLPRRPVRRLPDLDGQQRAGLARTLKRLLCKYDHLFQVSFPYSMGWHGAPFGEAGDAGHWQLHAHFYPPLLRSATVRKFIVGYELLAENQRDVTAEGAAARLRALPETSLRAGAQEP